MLLYKKLLLMTLGTTLVLLVSTHVLKFDNQWQELFHQPK